MASSCSLHTNDSTVCIRSQSTSCTTSVSAPLTDAVLPRLGDALDGLVEVARHRGLTL